MLRGIKICWKQHKTPEGDEDVQTEFKIEREKYTQEKTVKIKDLKWCVKTFISFKWDYSILPVILVCHMMD